MIKLVCKDEKFAEFARFQLAAMGRTTKVLGRAVVATGDYTPATTTITVKAKGYTEEPTEYDRKELEKLI